MEKNVTPTVGIDIGSHSVKVVVLGAQSRVMGLGVAESAGVVRGVVTNMQDAAHSVRAAVQTAETESGVRIDRCYVALSSESLLEHKVTVEMEIDGEVDDEVVEDILSLAKKKVEPELLNRTVLHEIPQGYWVDGTRTTTAPLSLRGTRLGVSVLYVSILESHMRATYDTLAEAGLTVAEGIAAPVASSLVTLTTLQKNAGCLHLLVGREMSVATIFENGSPTALRVFPTGSNTITEDVALAVTVSLAEAERLKLHAHTELMKEKKKVLAAIHKRHKNFANDVRLFIDSKRRVLPAGIILTGGGGQFSLLETDMRDLLRLPTSRATLPKSFGSNKKHHDASLTPAIGAALYGSLAEADYVRSSNAFVRMAVRAWRAFVAFLKTLLP